VVQRWSKGRLKVVGKFLRVEAQIGQLRHFLPLVEKVMTQTKERVWGGNCHVEGKVLSLFEPHTEVIRKGKAHKPNEVGRLVRIDEVENGIVSRYRVLPGNPDDTTAWMPAPRATSSVLRASARDGYRRPRFFFGAERACGAGPRSEKGGVTGARTSNGQAGQAAEAALVPASAALAFRL
jgi:hypothetical protein